VYAALHTRLQEAAQGKQSVALATLSKTSEQDRTLLHWLAKHKRTGGEWLWQLAAALGPTGFRELAARRDTGGQTALDMDPAFKKEAEYVMDVSGLTLQQRGERMGGALTAIAARYPLQPEELVAAGDVASGRRGELNAKVTRFLVKSMDIMDADAAFERTVFTVLAHLGDYASKPAHAAACDALVRDMKEAAEAVLAATPGEMAKLAAELGFKGKTPKLIASGAVSKKVFGRPPAQKAPELTQEAAAGCLFTADFMAHLGELAKGKSFAVAELHACVLLLVAWYMGPASRAAMGKLAVKRAGDVHDCGTKSFARGLEKASSGNLARVLDWVRWSITLETPAECVSVHALRFLQPRQITRRSPT